MERVLVAVDGEEAAGRATAYLIERASRCDHTEFVVVTVQSQNTDRANRKERVSVEGARPWLDHAGSGYQFSIQSGELLDVVNGYLECQAFSEVVVVSLEIERPGPFRRLLRLTRVSPLERIRKPDRTKITLVRQHAQEIRH